MKSVAPTGLVWLIAGVLCLKALISASAPKSITQICAIPHPHFKDKRIPIMSPSNTNQVKLPSNQAMTANQYDNEPFRAILFIAQGGEGAKGTNRTLGIHKQQIIWAPMRSGSTRRAFALRPGSVALKGYYCYTLSQPRAWWETQTGTMREVVWQQIQSSDRERHPHSNIIYY